MPSGRCPSTARFSSCSEPQRLSAGRGDTAAARRSGRREGTQRAPARRGEGRWREIARRSHAGRRPGRSLRDAAGIGGPLLLAWSFVQRLVVSSIVMSGPNSSRMARSSSLQLPAAFGQPLDARAQRFDVAVAAVAATFVPHAIGFGDIDMRYATAMALQPQVPDRRSQERERRAGHARVEAGALQCDDERFVHEVVRLLRVGAEQPHVATQRRAQRSRQHLAAQACRWLGLTGSGHHSRMIPGPALRVQKLSQRSADVHLGGVRQGGREGARCSGIERQRLQEQHGAAE
jgi:hypothetical protein